MPTAVKALKAGAFDFVEKPADMEMLGCVIDRAVEHRRLHVQAQSMAQVVQQWEATFDAVPDLVAILDLDHRLVRVNRAMANRLGCVPHEAVGQPCYACAHGANEPPAACPHALMVTDGCNHLAEVYEPRLGGHFLVSASPLRDESGQIIAGIHVMRDVTEQKATEEALRTSEEQYRAVVENIGIGVAVISPKMEILALNGQMREWYPRIDAAKRPLCYRVYNNPPRERICSYCPTCKTLEDGLVHEALAQPSEEDESLYFRIVSSPIKDAAGKVIAAIEMVEDITERKRADEALRENEGRFREVSLSITDIAYSCVRRSDGGQSIDWVTGGTQSLSGYSNDEFLALGCWKRLVLEEDHALFDKKVAGLVPGAASVCELRLRKKDGAVVWVASYCRCVAPKEPLGQVRLYGGLKDVTERKRLEAELARANRAQVMVSECNQALVRIDDETELLREICRLIAEFGGYRLAWVGYTQDDEKKGVRPVAWAGDDGYVAHVDVTWADEARGRGPVGICVREQRPVFVQNIAADESFLPWRDSAIQRGYGSVISLPLIREGRAFGALSIYAPNVDAFNAGEIRLLSELAGDMAYGIMAVRARAERERALREIEALAKFPAEDPSPVLRMTSDGVLLYANKASASLLAAWGWEIGHVVSADWRARVADAFERNANVQFELARDGRLFDFLLTPIIAAGYANVYGSDITGHRQAEDALRESEAFNKGIIESSRDCIEVLDLEGRLLFMSQRGQSLLKIEAIELYLSSPWADFWKGDENAAARNAVLRSREGNIGCLQGYRPTVSGNPRWWDVIVSPIFGADDEAQRLLAVSRDITDRKREEDTRTAVASVLRLSLEQIPMEEFLRGVLDLLLSIPWLSLKAQGAIFLVEDDPSQLIMKAQSGLAEPIRNACARLQFGTCLCGRAALSRAIQFADCVDARHEVRYEGMTPHGHYCVPIMSSTRVQGVINLYVAPGHRRERTEDEFLTNIANVLAGVIERKLGENALRENESRFATLFESSPTGLMLIDREHRTITQVNSAVSVLMGLPKESIIGKACHDFVCPAECQKCPICDLGQTVDRAERVLIRGDGSRLPILKTVVPIKMGGRDYLFESFIDITEKKQAEDALRASERQYREAHGEVERLLACMSSFLIGVDKDTRITRWNDSATQTFGLGAEQVIGKRLDECAIGWDYALMTKQAPGWPRVIGVVRLLEIRYTRPDRSEGSLGITINPIKNESGDPDGFFLLGMDITERRSLEMQLVQAQKLESIGQLAAGIAHEINTPTQYVGDNLEFLRDAFGSLGQLMDKYRELTKAAQGGRVVPAALIQEVESVVADMDLEYLTVQIPRAIEQSLDGVSRVAHIVQAMKEFSHPGTGERSLVDLNRAIENTMTVARNELKYVAETVMDLDPSLPLVLCLPGEINQVILNILVNAAHAIGDVVRQGKQLKGVITVSTRRDGDWAEIRIRDTGTGIPEAVRGRVFDPFFTTKDVGRGTGQGLAIARNVIVEKHGGTITFETEMGKGTIFIIRLPIEGRE